MTRPAMESDCEPDSIPKAAVNIAVQRSKHLRKLESAWQLGTNPARTAFANDEKHHGKCEGPPMHEMLLRDPWA